ncbi:hypothetical protein HSBAA_47430 [Vreelandella sulfidaeris]|uniref:PhoH-like protein domain-containing protein n=1 Tax=Vreelandella sulfidaeris TaxID=115553 RepID=A0A455UCU7_9GAMM|nr:hypothetical protein HSBAA_47430 [Halomonas sulfidaeris]
MIEGAQVYATAGQDGKSLWEALNVDVTVERVGHHNFYQLTGNMPRQWHVGMLVSDSENGAEFEAIIRELGPSSARLQLLTNYRHHAGVWGVHAHDSRQNFTLNLLMDPDIDLVTIAGNAGTGKTFMTLAAAFQQTLDAKLFERIVFTRAPIPMGEDIGFYPALKRRRCRRGWVPSMTIWITCCAMKRGESSWDNGATRQLIGSRVQIRSPSFMRGRTLNDTF